MTGPHILSAAVLSRWVGVGGGGTCQGSPGPRPGQLEGGSSRAGFLPCLLGPRLCRKRLIEYNSGKVIYLTQQTMPGIVSTSLEL